MLTFPTVLPLVRMMRAPGANLEFRSYDATHDGSIEKSVGDLLTCRRRHTD
jgi:hypothetical protein